MNRNREKLRLGKKGNRKIHEAWTSTYVQPSGKFWKRQAAKRARRYCELRDGMGYKKSFGWFEWS